LAPKLADYKGHLQDTWRRQLAPELADYKGHLQDTWPRQLAPKLADHTGHLQLFLWATATVEEPNWPKLGVHGELVLKELS
jgi:hypothetical protein